MTPLSGRISTNVNIPHQEQQHEDETIIAQPVPRSKPIKVPSPLWPRQSEYEEKHVNKMSQQGNGKEGNIFSSGSSGLERQSNYSDKDVGDYDEQEFIKCIVSSPNDNKIADHPLEGILIHRPSSVPNDANPPRGTPFFDATDAIMAPPARPQTVHFSDSPPQVFQYPPSEEYQHYMEKINNNNDNENKGGLILLPWPEEEDEAYKKQQEEKEKKMQARLQKINEAWI